MNANNKITLETKHDPLEAIKALDAIADEFMDEGLDDPQGHLDLVIDSTGQTFTFGINADVYENLRSLLMVEAESEYPIEEINAYEEQRKQQHKAIDIPAILRKEAPLEIELEAFAKREVVLAEKLFSVTGDILDRLIDYFDLDAKSASQLAIATSYNPLNDTTLVILDPMGKVIGWEDGQLSDKRVESVMFDWLDEVE